MNIETRTTAPPNLGAQWTDSGPDALPAVLCVDDDPNILDGFRRQLRKKFRVHTAIGATKGLEAISSAGPFGVVVSDFQMPGMDGIQFLTRVRAVSPDTVRIMLTGQTDFSTAMAAVNQGNIFRFLSKPCSAIVLEKVLEAGFDQHRLLIAERQLTQETLLGCVQVLMEVLSIVQPEAFSRATRVRRYVREIAAGIGLSGAWQLEAAAMLSQIGWITLPPSLLAKAAADEPMSDTELPVFLAHASAAAKILGKIPRLDLVATMIEKQHVPFSELPGSCGHDGPGLGVLGARVLHAAIDFDILRQSGLSHEDILGAMRRRRGSYAPDILDAFGEIEKTEASDEIRLLPVSGLTAGMILEDELRNENGMLLLGKGQEVTPTFAQRLSNFSYGLGPGHMCRVRVRKATYPAAANPDRPAA